jgi:hypothetical protein
MRLCTQMHTLFQGWAEVCGDVYTVQLGERVVVFTTPKDCKVSKSLCAARPFYRVIHKCCVCITRHFCSSMHRSAHTAAACCTTADLLVLPLQAVLDMRPGSFSRAKRVCDPVNRSGFRGVFTENGEEWKRHRRLTSSAFR